MKIFEPRMNAKGREFESGTGILPVQTACVLPDIGPEPQARVLFVSPKRRSRKGTAKFSTADFADGRGCSRRWKETNHGTHGIHGNVQTLECSSSGFPTIGNNSSNPWTRAAGESAFRTPEKKRPQGSDNLCRQRRHRPVTLQFREVGR